MRLFDRFPKQALAAKIASDPEGVAKIVHQQISDASMCKQLFNEAEGLVPAQEWNRFLARLQPGDAELLFQ